MVPPAPNYSRPVIGRLRGNETLDHHRQLHPLAQQPVGLSQVADDLLWGVPESRPRFSFDRFSRVIEALTTGGPVPGEPANSRLHTIEPFWPRRNVRQALHHLSEVLMQDAVAALGSAYLLWWSFTTQISTTHHHASVDRGLRAVHGALAVEGDDSTSE